VVPSRCMRRSDVGGGDGGYKYIDGRRDVCLRTKQGWKTCDET
jgi:hypothetical protein